ncbi:hypothetical protein PTKIN_Ptkin03bG0012000 [Pterospermum kingtungense]
MTLELFLMVHGIGRSQLRRNLFDWEVAQWEEFRSTLDEFVVVNSFGDRLVWKGHCSGKYSTKSFCWAVMESHGRPLHDWSRLWSGLLPPKVESLCWQIFHGKVAVKVNLAERNTLRGLDLSCSLCGAELESIFHLFFTCYYSWQIWSS